MKRIRILLIVFILLYFSSCRLGKSVDLLYLKKIKSNESVTELQNRLNVKFDNPDNPYNDGMKYYSFFDTVPKYDLKIKINIAYHRGYITDMYCHIYSNDGKIPPELFNFYDSCFGKKAIINENGVIVYGKNNSEMSDTVRLKEESFTTEIGYYVAHITH